MTVDYVICNLNHFPCCSYFCHISQMKNWGFVRVSDIMYIGSLWGNLIKLILISANHSVCPLPPCIIVNISWLFFVCVCVRGWSFFSLKKVCWSDCISSSARGMSVWPHGSADGLCLSCPLTTRFLCSWSSSRKRLSNKPHLPGLSHLKSDSDPVHLCWPFYLRMGLHYCRIFPKAPWSALVKVK